MLKSGMPRASTTTTSPVEDKFLRLQLPERLGNRAEPISPVMARACIDGGFTVAKLRLRAIAVEFYLVEPTRIRRGMRAQRRMTGLDEAGEGGAPRSGNEV
jgi:hypothetical protein